MQAAGMNPFERRAISRADGQGRYLSSPICLIDRYVPFARKASPLAMPWTNMDLRHCPTPRTPPASHQGSRRATRARSPVPPGTLPSSSGTGPSSIGHGADAPPPAGPGPAAGHGALSAAGARVLGPVVPPRQAPSKLPEAGLPGAALRLTPGRSDRGAGFTVRHLPGRGYRGWRATGGRRLRTRRPLRGG